MNREMIQSSRGLTTLSVINDLAWSLYNSNPLNAPKRNMNPKQISDILAKFTEHKVEYLIIGGFAMAFHGLPRATGDIDLWIKNSPENMTRLKEALLQSGFPEAAALRTTTQLVPGMSIFNLIDSDFKIDLMHYMKLFKEADFDDCFKRSNKGNYQGVEINVLNAEDLLNEKIEVNRTKDQEDITFLKEKFGK